MHTEFFLLFLPTPRNDACKNIRVCAHLILCICVFVGVCLYPCVSVCMEVKGQPQVFSSDTSHLLF